MQYTSIEGKDSLLPKTLAEAGEGYYEVQRTRNREKGIASLDRNGNVQFLDWTSPHGCHTAPGRPPLEEGRRGFVVLRRLRLTGLSFREIDPT